MVRRWAIAMGFLVASSATVFATPAHAQSRPDLEKARAAYLGRNYAEAETRLLALTDDKTGFRERLLLSQARMYLGATLLAEGKNEAAQEAFERLILEDSSFEPDPLSFPSNVINTFIDIRATLQDRLRQAAANAAKLAAERKARAEAERARQEAWLRDVKSMAEQEKITVKNQRIVAFLPFGAGQFQNRQPLLGWMFLSTEAALVVATGITVPMRAYAAERANQEVSNGDINHTATAYKNREENIRIANLGLCGALAVVAVAGIVHANLSFVPEFEETKRRPLPSLAKVSPTVLPLTKEDGSPAGAMLGVKGILF